MSRTVADASREYRQRQRGKLKRYEAALREIATGFYGSAAIIAKAALSERGEAGR